jgi:hypothetical protein
MPARFARERDGHGSETIRYLTAGRKRNCGKEDQIDERAGCRKMSQGVHSLTRLPPVQPFREIDRNVVNLKRK